MRIKAALWAGCLPLDGSPIYFASKACISMLSARNLDVRQYPLEASNLLHLNKQITSVVGA
jgi:hypothetical protein